MAVLTDILMAPASEAPAIIAQWPAEKRWPAFQTTGLDWLVLADLAEALGQSRLAREIEGLRPSSFADERQGPWVYVLPTVFRDQIADMAPDETGVVAKSWGDKEETRERGLTPQIAEGVLRELRALATRARDGQQPLLLWISL